jgi:hypothetical protein
MELKIIYVISEEAIRNHLSVIRGDSKRNRGFFL